MGIGTSAPKTKLDIAGAISTIEQTSAALNNLSINGNVSLFRISNVSGSQSNSITASDSKEGQLLIIVNEDDDDATFAGTTIKANGGSNSYIYANGVWHMTGTSATNTGPVGPTGPKGDKGATGDAGPAGAQGVKGDKGNDGAAGAQGPAGAAGAQGPAGPQGATGLLPNGVTGATPYYNGSAWVVNSTNIYNNGGNVGIGTASPGAYKLNVFGDALVGETAARHKLEIASKEWPELYFTTPTYSKNMRIGMAHQANASYGAANGDLYVYSPGTNRMDLIVQRAGGISLVNKGGSVGIGTTSPTYSKLQIEGAGDYDATLRLKNTVSSGADAFFVASNSGWSFGANKLGIGFGTPASSNVKMTIQGSDGNVGIGTTAPGSTLDVGGTRNDAFIQNLATWGLNARSQGVIIIPEGTVTDNGAGALTFGGTVIVMNPLSGSWIRVAAGTYTLGNWGALWINMPPTGTRGTTATPTVTAWSDGDRNYDGRDRILLAQRDGSGKIWTRFGTPVNPEASHLYNSVYDVSGATASVSDITGSFSTSSATAVQITGSSLTLTPGTWLINADAEVRGTGYTYDVKIGLYNSTDNIWHNFSTPLSYYFCPWHAMGKVTIAANKNYQIRIGSVTGYTVYARNVRISAIKVQ